MVYWFQAHLDPRSRLHVLRLVLANQVFRKYSEVMMKISKKVMKKLRKKEPTCFPSSSEEELGVDHNAFFSELFPSPGLFRNESAARAKLRVYFIGWMRKWSFEKFLFGEDTFWGQNEIIFNYEKELKDLRFSSFFNLVIKLFLRNILLRPRSTSANSNSSSNPKPKRKRSQEKPPEQAQAQTRAKGLPAKGPGEHENADRKEGLEHTRDQPKYPIEIDQRRFGDKFSQDQLLQFVEEFMVIAASEGPEESSQWFYYLDYFDSHFADEIEFYSDRVFKREEIPLLSFLGEDEFRLVYRLFVGDRGGPGDSRQLVDKEMAFKKNLKNLNLAQEAPDLKSIFVRVFDSFGVFLDETKFASQSETLADFGAFPRIYTESLRNENSLIQKQRGKKRKQGNPSKQASADDHLFVARNRIVNCDPVRNKSELGHFGVCQLDRAADRRAFLGLSNCPLDDQKLLFTELKREDDSHGSDFFPEFLATQPRDLEIEAREDVSSITLVPVPVQPGLGLSAAQLQLRQEQDLRVSDQAAEAEADRRGDDPATARNGHQLGGRGRGGPEHHESAPQQHERRSAHPGHREQAQSGLLLRVRLTSFLCKFFDEVEAEISAVDLLSVLVFEFRLELVFFLEVLLKIFVKIDKAPASVKSMILFRKIFDLLEFVLQRRLMKSGPGSEARGNRRTLQRAEASLGRGRGHRNEDDIRDREAEHEQAEKK